MSKISKLVLVATLVFISAFKTYAGAGDTPIKFNDALVSIVDQLYKNGTEWGTKFNSLNSTTKNFNELGVMDKKLMTYIDGKITELNGMKDVKGSEDFRKAMIEFLNFEKNLITVAFVPFEKLNKSSTDKEIQNALDNLTKEAAKEKDALKKVQDTQSAYAAKNNFSVRGAAHGKALACKF